MEDKLRVFFRRFTDFVEDFYNVPEIVKFLQIEIKRKRKIYPFWKKKVRFSYASYKKLQKHIEVESPQKMSYSNILQYFYHDDHLSKNKQIPNENIDKIIPYELPFHSIPYFKKKFEDLFSYFLTEVLPFDKNALSLTQYPIDVYRDIFFDLKYCFSVEDIKTFDFIRQHYNLQEKTEKLIEYFFSSLVHIFGMEIGTIIPENFQIEMISGVVQLNNINEIHFVKHVHILDLWLL